MWTEGRDRPREGASGQRAAPGDTPAGGRPAVGRRPNLLPRPVTRPRRQHAGLSAVGLGPGGEEGRVPRGRPSTACRGELGRGRGAAGSTMERARQAARRPLQNPEPGRPAAAPAAEVRGGDAERGQVGRERRPRGQPRREGGGGASGGRARLTRQAPPPPTALGKGHRKGARPEASARRAAPFSPLRPSSAPFGPSLACLSKRGKHWRQPRAPPAHCDAAPLESAVRATRSARTRGLRGEQPGRYPSQAPSRVVSAPGLPKTCQAGCDHPCVLRGVAAHRDPFVFSGLGKALSDAQTRALCVRSGARSGTQPCPGEQRRGPPRRH